MKTSTKSIIYLSLLLLPFFSAAQETEKDYTLKVQAKKGINHPDGSNDFTPYQDFATRTLQTLTGYKSSTVKLSRYGGWLAHKTTATGFFYTKKIDGRWWAIDPEGYYYIHNAMNAVNMGNSDRNKAALPKVYGDANGWIKQTHQMLVDDGFNGAGAWSNTNVIRNSPLQGSKPLAYTINLDFMSAYGLKRGGTYQVPGHRGYPNNVIFVFDPEFVAFSDEYAKRLTEFKDDANMFGYFSDNEMPLGSKNLEGYLTLKNHDDPGYIAAKKWIDGKGIKEDALTDQLRAEFLGYAADLYFSIVAKAIKKYDPNHMYLGCRFYGAQRDSKELQAAVGKYADAVSVNYYNHWTPNLKALANWEKWSGKPCLITEWYVKGEDSGLGNTSGAGWIVKSQEDRGLFYQNFTLGLIESKSCIGWHWFKYLDNDPLQKGAEPSNTDANKGIIDNNYQLYTPLVQKMKELNWQMYPLTSFFDKQNNK